MSIVWLASYPKSGNTWVRFLLYSAIYGAPSQSLDIAGKIPDIHRPIAFEPQDTGPQLCKTHFAYSEQHPKITDTQGAVLIVRDPRDVFFSALNYRRLAGLTSQQLSDEQYAKHYIAARGDPDFKSLGFGTWGSHALSWKNQSQFPVYVVKYEDLKADTSSELSKIIDFIGIDVQQTMVDKAVNASSFDTMRAMEIREKHSKSKKPNAQSLFIGTQSARQSNTYFMNTGKTGQSLASISPTIEKAFLESFAQDMAGLGY
jgi:Sulfotransferase domain